MPRRRRIEPSQFVVRYVLALSLIVLFVLGGHGLHIVTGKQGVLDEEVINISGRQRMLSQRIVLLSHRYMETGSEKYRSLLIDSLATFEDSHQWIMTKAVVSGTKVHDHYLGALGANLDRESRMFAELSRSLLAEPPGSEQAQALSARLQEVALVGLLGDLNTAVSLFEEAANDRARRLELIQLTAIAATLIVLLLEVVLIFYPAHRTMEGMIGRLRHQAWHDQMTGLLNRGQFLARVREMAEGGPERLDREFVLALDLDGFKEVNDTFGHPAGDQILKRVARIIEAELDSDPAIAEHAAARVGGDEFLVCGYAPAGDLPALAQALGDRIIAEVERPISVDIAPARDNACAVSVSIGYALGGQSHGNVEVFLSNADIALYESKRRGKGVTTAFAGSMREQAERRHQLNSDLKTGLRECAFQAFFQPQISLETGKIYGIEALARWDHPDRGLVAPDEFIPAAEESRLTDALDGQIMLDALYAFSRFRERGIDLGRLSLNASGLALRASGFAEQLLSVANACGLRPDQLTIEVLESVLIQDAGDPALATIRRLARAGVGVAIDDFGVGYSSLSRVTNVDITAIKIDRSLTSQVGVRSMDKVLSATAAMAKGLGATLLAEGIETEHQRAAMAALGVDAGQGFLWSKPLNLDDLEVWVEGYKPARVWLASSA